jgi:hypothetical protein
MSERGERGKRVRRTTLSKDGGAPRDKCSHRHSRDDASTLEAVCSSRHEVCNEVVSHVVIEVCHIVDVVIKVSRLSTFA